MNTDKELSAARDTGASAIFNIGSKAVKEGVLSSLPVELSEAHKSGHLHIHDLDSFNLVYNCSTPLPSAVFKPNELRSSTAAGKIFETIGQFRTMCCTLMHLQSGGIGSANTDTEIADALREAGIAANAENAAFLRDAFSEFIVFLSTMRIRYGRENIYLTLHVGLDQSELGRMVTHELLAALRSLPVTYTRPNIVFKVCKDINGVGKPNHDLYLEAVACTAQRMIPTYLLCDSEPNKDIDPAKLSIAGCRSRIYANRNGDLGSSGRGNIAAVSINLVRHAIESKGNVEDFFARLDETMDKSKRILILRRDALRKSPFVEEVAASGYWKAKNAEELLRVGTYAIGFIGLAETVAILGGGKAGVDDTSKDLGIKIVTHMRERANSYIDETGLNFSLLASAGEGICKRFPDEDGKHFPDARCWGQKGWYTNSFHVPVEYAVGISAKLKHEGAFHALCNGGSITYVELSEAPIGNVKAVSQVIDYATGYGVSYFGINFSLDRCADCGHVGLFDLCPHCGSTKIEHIRRVSGYLELENELSAGKRAEAANRRANAI